MLTSMPKQQVEKHITDDIPLAAQERLRRQAATTGHNFKEVFLKFADAHRGMNHSNQMTTGDICRLDVCIKEFMRSYREMFPSQNVTPKLHLLECHVVPQISRFRVGLGMLNEQGGELLHTELNRTGRIVHGIRDDLQKLLSIMKRHHTSTTPEIRASVLKTCKRKSKKGEE
ncbi:uncharacterized protein LOC119733744 [Patiria miniata]|uniref:Uncharacterized protein n=1 Tax=Patiria miniata TaxID=46514 RepID=A0A914AH50_PATMI|nr:uncharacterized protein LOC119733744 [Patiria miniata]